MGVYIPNMEKPKDCKKCPRLCRWDDGWGNRYKCLETGEEKHWKFPNPCKPTNCPLIEIDEEGIQKAKECLTVIKAMWRLFKIKVNESKELKQELLGMDSNLTIIDESYGERRNR